MKVIISGGGTGGHLFPALAIAEEFRKRDSSTEILFVGTEYGIEARIIPREGYPLRFIRARGFVGLSFFRQAASVWKMILSLMDSQKILNSFKPDIVIGVGGYASGPLVLTACMKSIPALIHEQNSVPGLTNKILGKFVKRVCVTYQESMSFFPPEKTYLTGNPVRMKILRGDRGAACRLFSLDEKLFTVFIFGGSSGARSINRAMVDAMNHIGDLRNRVQFLHQTGEKDCENIKEAYRKTGVKGTIAPFIYQMAEAYAVSDVVISRAGATTLAELTALGKPAILVPYPHAAGGHQKANAFKLKEMGGAFMLPDNELNGERIAQCVRELVENNALRKEMELASRGLGRIDASSRIVDLAENLLKEKSGSPNSANRTRDGRDSDGKSSSEKNRLQRSLTGRVLPVEHGYQGRKQ